MCPHTVLPGSLVGRAGQPVPTQLPIERQRYGHNAYPVEEKWIRRMSEQQSAPEQLAAGKSQGGAGATYKVVVFEFENFQGGKAEFSAECKDLTEKRLEKVGSLIVDSGPWVGYDRHGFTGEQFILEKGEYPRWDTWTNSQRSFSLLSLRPLKLVSDSFKVSDISLPTIAVLSFYLVNTGCRCLFLLFRIVLNTSYTSMRTLGSVAERWRLLMMMCQACGATVFKIA
ncbi:hypothetical protein CHARACLAT_003043 [Characodon lateralis]|uniref:Beta-crystallin B3 n=1 Tax=Characodon lateralis TaxID=208331 RepID=A0ABU7EJR6_9TELE|nr:hypothetical protein [Characodon lateralis]